MDNVETHPGFLELKKYIKYTAEPAFYEFIKSRVKDVCIWSLTSQARNGNTLYSLWKDIFVKLWKLFKNERYQCVMYDKESWSRIEKEVTLLDVKNEKMERTDANIELLCLSKGKSLKYLKKSLNA
ncbi:hypothetical protein BDC45DRAFT_564133 [Circinella umbellata]|nr:hypothetical protein BDC45DRAFT_564133 [Circinella umbellata]